MDLITYCYKIINTLLLRHYSLEEGGDRAASRSENGCCPLVGGYSGSPSILAIWKVKGQISIKLQQI